MRIVVLAVLVAACGFQVRASSTDDAAAGDDGAGPGPGSDGAMPDAAIDAMVDAAIDATPLLPCPPAPSGCTQFTCSPTACHYVCNDKRGWTSGRDRCVSLGLGCIATIEDSAENSCIAGATLPSFAAGTSVWFGFVQAASGTEPAGGWGWQCGSSSFVAGNWGTFEPNNSGGNEDCGLMIEGGAWIDGDCSTQARYVCELSRLP